MNASYRMLSLTDCTPVVLAAGETVILDHGRLRTGHTWLAGRGRVLAHGVPELRYLELIDQGICFDLHPEHYADPGFQGGVELHPDGTALAECSRAYRYLRLRNPGAAPIPLRIRWQSAEYPGRPSGYFHCDLPGLDDAWQRGIETVRLCTQLGEESQIPVFAPFGGGFVQWDGVYRDREIWGGDLRPGALAWHYNFSDPTPIANSLYLILAGQHVGCSEDGLLPGSASSHQVFYEWAFWEVVALREHFELTADRRLLRFAQAVVARFLHWCERKMTTSPDGWLHVTGSWMYTLNASRKFESGAWPALQLAAVAGLRAMAELLQWWHDDAPAGVARRLAAALSDRFDAAFWSAELGLYRIPNLIDRQAVHSDLCANALALTLGVAPEQRRSGILRRLRELHWRRSGSINIAPPLGVTQTHDNQVWPYANAYEITARFAVGDGAGAVELLQRLSEAHRVAGMATWYEFLSPDGEFPMLVNPTTPNSSCHAWAAQCSWALQRYLLGVAPCGWGWQGFQVAPLAVPGLKHLAGGVTTPDGLIEVELERRNSGWHGVVRHPGSLTAQHHLPGVEYITARQGAPVQSCE